MSSSQETLDDTRLAQIRQQFLNSSTYLGEPNNTLVKNVTWERLERGYHLVINDTDNKTGIYNFLFPIKKYLYLGYLF